MADGGQGGGATDQDGDYWRRLAERYAAELDLMRVDPWWRLGVGVRGVRVSAAGRRAATMWRRVGGVVGKRSRVSPGASQPRAWIPEHADVVRPPGIEPVTMPTSSPRRSVRVAAVLDDFSMQVLAPEVQLIALTPTNWRQVLDTRPDVLLVESAWSGPQGQWQLLVRRDQPGHGVLAEMAAAFSTRGIPTVFWNKEDPLHFGDFADAARLFDRVYTTDADMVGDYADLVGADRCGVWPFAAQPLLHNPVGVGPGRDQAVAFAGGWYADRYPQRRVQMFQVVDPARHHGLHIYSRFGADPMHQFPAPLDRHVVGSLSYPETLHVYKRYRVHLNVNSVLGSTSMCSRRLLELAASGTPVVSGASPAIVGTLGPGVVVESEDPLYTDAALTSLLDDDVDRARRAVVGVRRVLGRHTYAHRIDAMLADVGVTSPESAPGAPADASVGPPEGVVVVLESSSVEATRRAIAGFAGGLPSHSTLVVVPHGGGGHGAVGGDVDLLEQEARAAGFVGMRILSSDSAGHLAGQDDDRPVVLVADWHHYGPDFVGDLILAQLYRPDVAIGKAAYHQWERGGVSGVGTRLEYTDTDRLHPSAMLVPASVLRRVVAEAPGVGLLAGDHHHFAAGGFATDRFNFLADGARGGGAGSGGANGGDVRSDAVWVV